MAGPGSNRGKWAAGVVAAGVGLALAGWWTLAGGRAGPADRAEAAYDRGDYREARALSVAILTRSPEDRRATRTMARASGRLGSDETAQTLYGRLGEASMAAEDFFVLGSTLERLGQVVPAVAVLERGRALDPGHAETLNGLARLYAVEGRLPEAIAAAGRLAEAPGWEARGSLILGVLDVEDADPPGASAAIGRALRADPNLTGGITSPAEARKLLAGSLLRDSRPAPAIEAIRAVLASKGDPEASWLLSRAYLQSRDLGQATRALADSGEFAKDDPTRPDPAPHVGAQACSGCHAAIYRAQRASRHSRTFSAPEDLKGLALPDGAVADKAVPGASHALRREGGSVRLTSRSGDKALKAWIAFAVGSGDRGLTMVARDEKGQARVCRVSSYLGGTLWDQTSHAADPHPDDPDGLLGRPMGRGAEEKCIGCHVTSPRAARDRKVPEALDRGIGCERCHGPGGNHLVAVSLGFPEAAIARPSRASADQITRLCGACHKADDPSTRDTDPRFVRFQATTLPLSRCYTEGQGAMSCITCHDPHRDAETRPEPYEARCLACHGPDRESAPSKPHAIRRVPCPVDPARGCVGCHMPKVEGAAPHATFTDHQIRARKPPLTVP